MSENLSRIVRVSEDHIIAYKAHGVPTVPLKGQSLDGTLLGLVSLQYPQILSVKGKNPWEGGTLHRLDTATAGMVFFALTQDFFDRFQYAQEQDLIVKRYIAKTQSTKALADPSFVRKADSPDEFSVSTYFRSYGPGAKEVRPTLDPKRADSPRLYTTRIHRIADEVYECFITRGFRHQIRAHLAMIGHAIEGDSLYNENHVSGQIMELECVEVSFEDCLD